MGKRGSLFQSNGEAQRAQLDVVNIGNLDIVQEELIVGGVLAVAGALLWLTASGLVVHF